jgi:5'-phosphate synthase pdxT subunit
VNKIGILALQGNFQKHKLVLDQLGIESTYVRYTSNLDEISGLIIPGGESTTMTKLLNRSGLFESISLFANKYPILGTCAGLIMMANNAMDDRVNTFKLLDIDIERNASGRQIDSLTEPLTINYNNFHKKIDATFIRAPKIIRYGKDVNVIASYKGAPCAIQSGKHVGLSFHPELNGVSIFHEIAFNNIISNRGELHAA